MLYFKNTDLATTYHVSLRTVLNWIEAAKEGKLDLDLYTYNDRHYVANTTKNIAKIGQIVTDRKKYRNKRGAKIVTPVPAFYEVYDRQQVFDIIFNLDFYREIPFQYTYFNGGAEYWEKYTQRLTTENSPNLLSATQKLLAMNEDYIDNLLDKYDRVNVIDLGVGNGVPAKSILNHLLVRGILGRYVAIDISGEMLQLAKANVKEWFGDQVDFEGHILDFSHDRFIDLLANDYMRNDSRRSVNLVLCFGGTLSNFRTPDTALQAIRDSMSPTEDILLLPRRQDTESSRRYFDFRIGEELPRLDPQARSIVDMLNIDEAYYDAETGYDQDQSSRYIRIRLNVALTLKFAFGEESRCVEFNKGDEILLWRSWHVTTGDIVSQLNRNGFDVLQVSQTEDQEYLLSVSRVRSSSQR